MALEVERKFMVVNDGWRSAILRDYDVRQAYLAIGPPASVRVRVKSGVGYLNVKQSTLATARAEFEYVVPVKDAEEMMASLRIGSIVAKTRYEAPWAGRVWEVDVFGGENHGLVIAEVELDCEGEAFEEPPWTGPEVSGDPRYFNSYLALRPYRTWPEHTRLGGADPD